MSEQEQRGNGLAAVREVLDKAPEVQPRLDEVDVAALKVKHRDLTTELDRLAEIKRKADAGEIGQAVFEAERFNLAEKYKKQGMTPAKALAEVEQRLRPPMSPEDTEAWLAAKGRTQRDEVLQIGQSGQLWHDADRREAYATIKRDGRRETWKVRSRDFRLYVIAEYRRRHGRVPAKQATGEGVDAIEATAQDGPVHEVFVRVAGVGKRASRRSISTWSTTVGTPSRSTPAAGASSMIRRCILFDREAYARCRCQSPATERPGSANCGVSSTCAAPISSCTSAGSLPPCGHAGPTRCSW